MSDAPAAARPTQVRPPSAVTLALAGGAIAIAAAAPLFLPPFIVSVLSLILIGALLAASVNMLAGEAGLISIGHAGIAGAAAYGVAWAVVNGHDVAVQLALAAVLTLGASAVYGLTTMRTRGIVFLMITLALGMVVYGLALRLSSVTGGQNGLTGISRPPVIGSQTAFYLLVLAVFTLAIAGLWILHRSPFGLTLRGVRDSETRMASLGYSVARIKLAAVMLSGALAGVAGVLAVWHTQFMSPAAATFARSALAVVMVILGGTGTLLGPLVGAAVVVGTEHWLSSYVERWPTLLGVIFILVVLFAPRGVMGAIHSFADRFHGRRVPQMAAAPAASPPATAVSAAEGSPLAVGNLSSDRWQEEELE
jgi:branched-chain amino acid transport system permease protein